MKSLYLMPLVALASVLGPGCDEVVTVDEVQRLFALTEDAHPWDTDDFDLVCSQAFGSAYRLADWHDIVAYVDDHGIEAFFVESGLTTYQRSGWVMSNRVHFFSSNRHYFVERHDGNVPGGWLVHATVEANALDLGSWYDARPALCFAPK